MRMRMCSCSGGGARGAPISEAARRVRAAGMQLANVHWSTSTRSRSNLGEIVRSHRKILVPEMNMGQLAKLVRAEFLVDARSLTKVQGLASRAAEIEAEILEMIDA